MLYRLGLITAFSFLYAACATFPALAQEPPEILSHQYGFGADIPGCADASKNIREIAIDELNIDAREMTTGLDVEYRLYGPGQAHWGSAKFTSACTLGGSKELQLWWQEAAKGKNIRRDVTITWYKRDKSPGRSCVLLACEPTAWSESIDPVRGEAVETITVSPGRIVFVPGALGDGSSVESGVSAHAQAGTSDNFAQVRGFKVEIAERGQPGKDVDTAWESISGPELVINLQGASASKTNSPGHKTVGEITLRGAMTDGRHAMCQWINDTVEGKQWKRMLTITELLSVDGAVKDGKAYEYKDCFPVGYVFPRMSVTNTTGNVMEEVRLKAVRETKELPAGATGKITIPDAPIASRTAVGLRLNDLSLAIERIDVNGDARNPTAKIICPAGTGKELEAWYRESLNGVAKPRTITIEILRNGRPTGRSYTLIDCFPTNFAAVNFDTSSTVQTETLTVNVGYIKFST